MTDALTDARGVPVEAGDTVLWGYHVDRSIAMAEGVVLAAEPCGDDHCPTPTRHQTLSLTPTGRVRIRVTRRSMCSGAYIKPVVDVAPDRFVVLKRIENCGYRYCKTLPTLPPSPLPTQEDAHG